MQRGQSARELLRASALDAAAVRRYLESADAEELDALLDGISRRDAKKKRDECEADEWLPLVHALVQCDATRFRAATRIVQVLWNGAVSELEAMQLLTEVNLGFTLAIEEMGEHRGAGRQLRRAKVVEEIHMLLQASYRLVRDTVTEQGERLNSLPQVLGLVPSLFGMLADVSEDLTNSSPVHDKLVDLLELPWTTRTLPFLLDALKDSSAFISSDGWELLQHNVAQMVLSSASISGEVINLIFRECVSVADVTNSTQWIDIARFLLRKLPVASRQEAEFNLQMGLHQSQRLVELVIQAIQDSADTTTIVSERSPEEDALRVNCAPGWHDLIFLLHTLQASKPILHHRSASARVARESRDFKEIECLIWRIFAEEASHPSPSEESPLFSVAKVNSTTQSLDALLSECVSRVINFGGKQAYAREWKALLLMDVSLFWLDQSCYHISNINAEDNSADSAANNITKRLLSQHVLLALFQKSPEAQNEILRSLLDRAHQPVFAQANADILRKLFESNPPSLHLHLNTIQDWLSSFQSSEQFFVIGSRLSMYHRSLFNFLMVFLRKLLSTGNQKHQRFAISLWCTWLEDTFRFDEQQEEEIVAALKSAVQVCVMIRSWSMGRIEKLFGQGGCMQLRDTTRQDLHQFLSQEVARFIQPAASHRHSNFDVGPSNESEDDNDDEEKAFKGQYFDFCALDDFYHQDSSPHGTAAVGLLFQKSLASLLAFEKAMVAPTKEFSPFPGFQGGEGPELRRWIAAFVSNQDAFFRWICQTTNMSEKRSVWDLLVRMFMGSALCTLTLEYLLEEDGNRQHLSTSSTSIWSIIEMEFCIHRMAQRTLYDSEKKIGWSIPRGFSSTFKHGLVDVLKAHTPALLGLMHSALRDGHGNDSTCQAGISFDTIIFILDMLSHSNEDNATPTNRTSHKKKPALIWSPSVSSNMTALLELYREISDQVLAQAAIARSASREDSPRVVFAVYEDTFALKVPSSHRYLISTGNQSSSATVVLDIKSGDELLGRLCSALARAISACDHESSIADMQSQISTLLKAKCWSAIAGNCDGESGNSILALAQVILSDIQLTMQSNEITKWKMGAALLAKRLCDVPGVLAEAAQRVKVEQFATQIICDHVVHHLPLLRLLLGISFVSLRFQFSSGDVASMVGRLHSILHGCGFSLNPIGSCADHTSSARKRKRLRQATSTANSSDDSESETMLAFRDTSVPHLVSSGAQGVALESLIIQVDQLVAIVTSYLQVKRNPAFDQRQQHAQALIPVLDALRVSVYSSRDFSWVSSKVLSRALSIIESTLRIGAKCDMLSDYREPSNASVCAVEVFDCAAQLAAQSRMWVHWLTDAISDSSSKTRLSAIGLKLDIFLLKVPTKAQSLLKKELPAESVAKLKRVVQMAKSNISSGSLNTENPTRLSRAQYVDVVPIVRKKKRRLRSRHPIIDAYLHEEDGDDAFADLEDFIE